MCGGGESRCHDGLFDGFVGRRVMALMPDLLAEGKNKRKE